MSHDAFSRQFDDRPRYQRPRRVHTQPVRYLKAPPSPETPAMIYREGRLPFWSPQLMSTDTCDGRTRLNYSPNGKFTEHGWPHRPPRSPQLMSTDTCDGRTRLNYSPNGKFTEHGWPHRPPRKRLAFVPGSGYDSFLYRDENRDCDSDIFDGHDGFDLFGEEDDHLYGSSWTDDVESLNLDFESDLNLDFESDLNLDPSHIGYGDAVDSGEKSPPHRKRERLVQKIDWANAAGTWPDRRKY